MRRGNALQRRHFFKANLEQTVVTGHDKEVIPGDLGSGNELPRTAQTPGQEHPLGDLFPRVDKDMSADSEFCLTKHLG